MLKTDLKSKHLQKSFKLLQCGSKRFYSAQTNMHCFLFPDHGVTISLTLLFSRFRALQQTCLHSVAQWLCGLFPPLQGRNRNLVQKQQKKEMGRGDCSHGWCPHALLAIGSSTCEWQQDSMRSHVNMLCKPCEGLTQQTDQKFVLTLTTLERKTAKLLRLNGK